MKRIIALFMCAALLLGLCCCRPAGEDLQFYVIRGKDARGITAPSALLRVAKEEGRLAFTGADLLSWQWDNHHITLREVSIAGQNGAGSALFMAEREDLFLLVLNGEVLFAGEFEGAQAVRNPMEIYIKDGEGDDFYLNCHRLYEEAEDPRNQSALYDYLIDMNLLISEGGGK